MINDVKQFIDKFEFEPLSKPGFHPALDARNKHLQEELDEIMLATETNDLPQLIDGLLDIVYVALGTAYLCGFDVSKHWNEIQKANMSKVRGITKRGHAYDVIKPEGWVAPDHGAIL